MNTSICFMMTTTPDEENCINEGMADYAIWQAMATL